MTTALTAMPMKMTTSVVRLRENFMRQTYPKGADLSIGGRPFGAVVKGGKS